MTNKHVDELVVVTERNNANTNTAIMRLKGEPYDGIEYSYGSISVKEKEGEECKVEYEFHILKLPENSQFGSVQDAETDIQLQRHVGDILVALINENLSDESESTKNNS